MFFSLFGKECKMISKSIIFYAFIIVVILFYCTQYEQEASKYLEAAKSGQRVSEQDYGKVINDLVKPTREDGYYGEKEAEIPEQIIPRVAWGLYIECRDNGFRAYPYGFYKKVKLKENDLARAKEIFQEITGFTIEEVSEKLKSGEEDIPINADLTYDSFKVLMAELRDMIGAMSSYSNLKQYGSVPMTYEEALAEYNNLVEKDKVSGGFARLFSDYVGIVVGFFPIFFVVAYALKDKRAGMQELIYSRKASAFQIVGARFLALIVMMFLPILILAVISTITLYTGVKPMGLSIDSVAFVRYSMIWLLPTLLMTTAIGYFLTELTQSAIGIIAQGVLWIIMLVRTDLTGDYMYALVIRHNSILEYDIYVNGKSLILINRIGYTCLAIIIMAVTVLLFDRKRRGKWHVQGKHHKILRSRKN